MLKGQDVVLLLAAVVREDDPSWADRTVRGLAAAVGYDLAGTNRALRRLAEVGLFDAEERQVRRTVAAEFLEHAVRFMFPAAPGEVTRGVPTLWGAPPIEGKLRVEGLPPVWPDPFGTRRGVAFRPLHAIALSGAKSHARLYEGLVVVDALRVSGARERALGVALVRDWLGLAG